MHVTADNILNTFQFLGSSLTWPYFIKWFTEAMCVWLQEQIGSLVTDQISQYPCYLITNITTHISSLPCLVFNILVPSKHSSALPKTDCCFLWILIVHFNTASTISMQHQPSLCKAQLEPHESASCFNEASITSIICFGNADSIDQVHQETILLLAAFVLSSLASWCQNHMHLL